MAEESSGAGGYMPVPVILEPVDDDDEDNRGNEGQRGNPSSQKNSSNTADNITDNSNNENSSSNNNSTNNSNNINKSQASPQTSIPQTTQDSHPRRRQNPSLGTSEEATPLTLRRCIQSPHETLSPEQGAREQAPGGLLSVEEGDGILEASSIDGDGCNNDRARRVSGCSSGSAISSNISRGGGHHHQHHVVVVATPLPSPAPGGRGCGNGATSSKNCDGPGEGVVDTPPRSEVHDSDEHDPHDNHNINQNDSEDDEELMFPGFAPKTFYVLDQKNFFRLWCLRCITWPYPFDNLCCSRRNLLNYIPIALSLFPNLWLLNACIINQIT
ncbi:voltage-dependent t-type calcium channel subunit alpha [Plakobranchus ocellatus]|uniref:Voltage-dependent t-type calcium channel subunit alpha n=1 Tax=Plakobranchus ocellatus TaxID=259542 RepID=A0AAV4DC64_9GAST|nr:voltage-dependent t-type calcium channel subunit alpha [Plakobranchus ocellatus]